MSYRVLRAAPSPSSPLFLGFLIGRAVDDAIREALPGFGIVATADDVLAPSRADVDAARKMAGATPGAPLVLCGYSAGCQAVRALLLLSIPCAGVVTIDGTAAPLTGDGKPAQWAVDVWKRLADEARRALVLWVATCTQQSYVEHLGTKPFAWDRHVLEAAIGRELPPNTEVHESGLHVLSMPSASIDAGAHARQLTSVLPALLRELVAPWFDHAAPSERTPVPTEPPDTTPSPVPPGFPTLAELALEVAREELAAGVREEPPGSNDGPRIREYREPSGLGPCAWCALFASWCDRQGGHGLRSPLGYQAAVAGLWRAGMAAGWCRHPNETPEPGWLAIFARAGQDPRTGGQGHVGRVESWDAVTITTIDGNVGDRVARVTRARSTVLGWIADRPAAELDGETAGHLLALAEALDAGTADGLDAIARAIGA